MSGITILCSGQGFQSVDMFHRFKGTVAEELIQTRAAELPEKVGRWLLQPDEPGLHDGEIVQPALTVYGESAWRILAPQLPSPALVLGYSLGQLCACGVAGMISWRDVHKLAAERGAAMARASPTDTSLLAVSGCDAGQVAESCRTRRAHVAIINGPTHVVVGAQREDLPVLIEEFRRLGAHTVRELPVAVAAHTPWLRQAAEVFRHRLQGVTISPAKMTLLSGASGSPIRTPAQAIEALSEQIAQPLDWSGALRQALERRSRLFLELGPGHALCRMVLDHDPTVQARGLDEFSSSAQAAHWVRTRCSSGC